MKNNKLIILMAILLSINSLNAMGNLRLCVGLAADTAWIGGMTLLFLSTPAGQAAGAYLGVKTVLTTAKGIASKMVAAKSAAAASTSSVKVGAIAAGKAGLKAAKDFSVAHETTTEVTATGLKMYGFDVVKNQAGKAANFVERKFRGKKPAPSNQTRSNNNKKKKELTDKEKQKLREFLIAMEKAKAEAQKAQENKED